MDIRYTYKARRDLEKFSAGVQKRIAKKMRFYAVQRDPLKFAKRLANPGEGEFRFHIGSWRVFFDVARDTIFILKISPRDKAYS